jgi:putative transposase
MIMNVIDLKIGSEVFHHNSRYRIIGILDLEHISARSSTTGTIERFHISEISHIPNNDENPAEIIPAKELINIPDQEWVEAHNKALLFSGILQLEMEERRLRLRDVAKQLGISEPTAYRQLQKFKASEGDPLSLLRKKRDDSYRFDEATEALIQQAINGYLTDQQKSIVDVYRDLELLIYNKRKENLKSAINEEIKTPHINTIRYRIANLTASEVAAKRKGKKGKEEYRPIIGEFPEPQKPLEVVQIDHTPLDLIIVDDENRLDIGRPTITLAIDVYSRMVTGFYVSLEKPNTLLTGCCLTHSILDKQAWLIDHGVEGEWPVYGVMDTIHTDNGKEFHGKSLLRACERYKINLTKRPAGTPRYGGHIERLFKTFNDGGIHALPGTTKSNVQGRGGYQSEKKAAITLREFETWYTEFIVNVYHKTVHSELGMTPLDKYKRGLLGDGVTLGRGLPTKIADPIRLKIDFLPYEERSVQKYGLQLFGIDYFHDVLRKWIKQPDKTRKGSQKFIIRYDPRDMSAVFFYDPDLESYVVVPYRNMSRPPISLWELKALKKKAAEFNPNKPIDEEAIFEARSRMAKIVENSTNLTKHVRRQKQKEAIRQKESIPSIVNTSSQDRTHTQTLNPAFNDLDNEDFDDIRPFEDIEP